MYLLCQCLCALHFLSSWGIDNTADTGKYMCVRVLVLLRMPQCHQEVSLDVISPSLTNQRNASVLWATSTQPVRNRKDIITHSFNSRPITHVELAKPTFKYEISQWQSGERGKFWWNYNQNTFFGVARLSIDGLWA